MKHPYLLIAGGLALLSGAALLMMAGLDLPNHPRSWRWAVVAAFELTIAGVALYGAFKVGRGQAGWLAVAAIIPAFFISALGGLSSLEDGYFQFGWAGQVRFVVTLVGTPLVVLFAALELIVNRGKRQQESIPGKFIATVNSSDTSLNTRD